MQSVIFSGSSSSYRPRWDSLLIRYGSSAIGQTLTHLAHLMQLPDAGLRASQLRIITMPDVPFVTGASILDTARPIIGPPLITFSES